MSIQEIEPSRDWLKTLNSDLSTLNNSKIQVHPDVFATMLNGIEGFVACRIFYDENNYMAYIYGKVNNLHGNNLAVYISTSPLSGLINHYDTGLIFGEAFLSSAKNGRIVLPISVDNNGLGTFSSVTIPQNNPDVSFGGSLHLTIYGARKDLNF